MKLTASPQPLERTELLKLMVLTPLTKATKMALKSGTTPETILLCAVECGYTRAGAYSALREAGHRTRKVRSDKGLTIRNRIQKLINQARDLEAKLAQQDDGGSDGK